MTFLYYSTRKPKKVIKFAKKLSLCSLKTKTLLRKCILQWPHTHHCPGTRVINLPILFFSSTVKDWLILTLDNFMIYSQNLPKSFLRIQTKWSFRHFFVVWDCNICLYFETLIVGKTMEFCFLLLNINFAFDCYQSDWWLDSIIVLSN